MLQIRHRPIYPGLKYDRSQDRGGKTGYSPKCLTGGIMAAWCTHSICHGFHSMPSSEGRDDQVIYNFTCTLGPYCMTREGDFFSETKFLIDHFHAAGHKKCLNSSATKCGNSVMAHIHKSVSYMGQYCATLYMKTFLCIWNCTKMQKLAGYNAVHNSS
ncbi:hypothetical protein BDQ17DRAFT_1387532 [Cyathus striatus]|nr:hypothetical protein BDQ17DRAFT_1387532 [Cyathus striatus]